MRPQRRHSLGDSGEGGHAGRPIEPRALAAAIAHRWPALLAGPSGCLRCRRQPVPRAQHSLLSDDLANPHVGRIVSRRWRAGRRVDRRCHPGHVLRRPGPEPGEQTSSSTIQEPVPWRVYCPRGSSRSNRHRSHVLTDVPPTRRTSPPSSWRRSSSAASTYASCTLAITDTCDRRSRRDRSCRAIHPDPSTVSMPPRTTTSLLGTAVTTVWILERLDRHRRRSRPGHHARRDCA